jgi:hypothetical protein
MGHVDLNEPWSFAFSPDISCLQVDRYPVASTGSRDILEKFLATLAFIRESWD